MTQSLRRLLAVMCLTAVAGCASTRTIDTREEFAHLPAGQPIRVYAQHDRVYLLRQFGLTDTLVQGSGTLTERAEATPFEGTIPFSQVVAITSTSPDVMKTLVFVGLTAMFVAALEDATGSGGLVTKLGTRYHFPTGTTGTGSSCPYVYAWDGAHYTLQAEPFGVAWGRALERTTSHLLPAARAEDGLVRLRLSNERRESHFVNSVRASAIELGSAPAAVLDGEGTAWPLYRPVPPVSATDRPGHDILPWLAVADGREWECDSTGLRAGSGYEDVLELSFTRPAHAAGGTLVLSGINTTLSSAVYEQLCTWVGDQTPALAHAVETDPELIAELDDYLRDASLSVSVWNGFAWVGAGAFTPEANAVSFTRGLRIRVPEGAGEAVRVRLRSMADVWRIDAVALDWSPVRPLPATPLRLVSATGPSGEDVRDEIGADDRHYTVLLPPDRLDLAFAAGRVPAGRRVAYAVAARGYLMEWDPPAAEARPLAPASWVPAAQRIETLKEILRHRDLALAPAYEAWRRSRVRGAGLEASP